MIDGTRPPMAAISTRIDGRTGIVLIDRPARRNAMDKAFVDICSERLRAFDGDPAIRSVVLHATTSGFCAGSDLKFIAPMSPEEIVSFEETCGDLGRQIAAMAKPVVAAVEMFAIGGGFTLATSCDLVVSGRSARWSLPEVPIGWLTPWGIWSLIARCGPVRSRMLCWCLEPIDAAEARRLGVVDYICDDDDALAYALTVADRLNGCPKEAVESTKAFFSTRILQGAEVGEARSSRIFSRNLGSGEARRTLERFFRPRSIGLSSNA